MIDRTATALLGKIVETYGKMAFLSGVKVRFEVFDAGDVLTPQTRRKI